MDNEEVKKAEKVEPKAKKKGLVISAVICLIILLLIPAAVIAVGFGIPAQYDETYYGELPHMFNRLKKGKEGKIILIGNSSLAFGARTDLISQELDREVVLFGLYGAIGTKAMIDLSRVGIKKNDIVVLAPEISEQGLSLYFSSKNMWMSIDGHYDMLTYLGKDNAESMTGNFASFAADKFSWSLKGKKPSVEGVYQQASFNLDGQEVGYMTYEKPYNMMINGVDSNNLISINTDYLTTDFVEYLNKFNRYVSRKGASLYYGFVPMNRLALISDEEANSAFHNFINEKLSFPIMGQLDKYVYDYEWFYDSNVHLNSSGMYLYTYQLVDDLKIILGDSSPTNIEIPEKPVIPVPDFEEGDNSDVDCFTYETFDDGYIINGLTEKGLEKTSIIIPSTYNDLPVISFKEEVFQNNKVISEVIIQKNVRSLANYCFRGCEKLTRIVLRHDSPSKINVGTAFLIGADNASVYVKASSYEVFINHYNWAYYRDRIKKY